jgi:flagellar hook-associated protein 3 FlgL
VTKNGAATAVVAAPYTPGAAITVDGMSFHVSGAPANGDTFSLAPSTHTLDPFAALSNAIAALGNPSANAGQVLQAVSAGTASIDSVSNQLQSARSVAGAAMNQLNSMTTENQALTLAAQTAQSNAQDVDMVKAISDFQKQQTSYQAALQSYSMVHQMSLFNYLK